MFTEMRYAHTRARVTLVPITNKTEQTMQCRPGHRQINRYPPPHPRPAYPRSPPRSSRQDQGCRARGHARTAAAAGTSRVDGLFTGKGTAEGALYEEF